MTQFKGTSEYAIRQDGWILRDDLRRGMPDLDDSAFADLMRRMQYDGLAEFKLIGETTWMRVTEMGLSTSAQWQDAVSRAH